MSDLFGKLTQPSPTPAWSPKRLRCRCEVTNFANRISIGDLPVYYYDEPQIARLTGKPDNAARLPPTATLEFGGEFLNGNHAAIFRNCTASPSFAARNSNASPAEGRTTPASRSALRVIACATP